MILDKELHDLLSEWFRLTGDGFSFRTVAEKSKLSQNVEEDNIINILRIMESLSDVNSDGIKAIKELRIFD